jgi:hypothetical protein
MREAGEAMREAGEALREVREALREAVRGFLCNNNVY